MQKLLEIQHGNVNHRHLMGSDNSLTVIRQGRYYFYIFIFNYGDYGFVYLFVQCRSTNVFFVINICNMIHKENKILLVFFFFSFVLFSIFTIN